MLAAVAALRPGGAALDRRGRVYASRKLLRMLPEVRGLARSASLRSIVERALGTGAFPVRGLLFDKTTETNWMVPWHQDLTIAVRARVETPGFAPWTVKEGVPHVQPPVEIMARMVAVRVPLDEDEPSRGPLRVIPGSHREGRLGAEATQGWLRRVPAGDVPGVARWGLADEAVAVALVARVGRSGRSSSPRDSSGVRGRTVAGRSGVGRILGGRS